MRLLKINIRVFATGGEAKFAVAMVWLLEKNFKGICNSTWPGIIDSSFPVDMVLRDQLRSFQQSAEAFDIPDDVVWHQWRDDCARSM